MRRLISVAFVVCPKTFAGEQTAMSGDRVAALVDREGDFFAVCEVAGFLAVDEHLELMRAVLHSFGPDDSDLSHVVILLLSLVGVKYN